MRSRTWRWTSSAESSHARSFINLCCGICEASCASLAVTVICVLLWLVRRHFLKTVVFQIPNKTCSFRSLDATLSGHWLMVSVMLLTQDNWLLVNVMLLTQVSWLIVNVTLLTLVSLVIVNVTLLTRVNGTNASGQLHRLDCDIYHSTRRDVCWFGCTTDLTKSLSSCAWQAGCCHLS